MAHGHLEYEAADAGADLGGEKFGEAGSDCARGKKDWGELELNPPAPKAALLTTRPWLLGHVGSFKPTGRG